MSGISTFAEGVADSQTLLNGLALNRLMLPWADKACFHEVRTRRGWSDRMQRVGAQLMGRWLLHRRRTDGKKLSLLMWCVFRTRSFSMQCIYHSLELSSSSIRDTAPVQTSPGCSQLRDGMYRRSRSELPFSDPRWPPDSETSSENPNFVSQLTFVRPLAPSTTSIALRIRVAPPSGETCHLVRRGS